jgi:hypothetical protein
LVLGAGIEPQTNALFTAFLEKTMQMNNSTIKLEVVKYLLGNPSLKAQFDNELHRLKTEDKNPMVRGLLEGAL